ncbi:hypothetical protein BU23DRAFT_581991 [Bimuria novae-zelandiae CBS 107.79]|uniref:CFEM domain-containing protein n=1 Tax=Bimuria novae-zelandiae CBS 107.79 TaxID=1447943 RepID=A0A6A5V085_9PLEO|nr:hypothetical protein BU23DRAFT_581991 [Bimuria novae-zelandiae CBS 107.79]
MGLPLILRLSIGLLGLSWATIAQSQLPECAQPCHLAAFSTNICIPTNLTCICTNEVFQTNVTLCVAASCTVPDQLSFVIVRIAFELLVARVEIGADAWTVLAAATLSLPSAIITIYGIVKHGLGQHIWTLRPEQITTMLKYFYVMAALYYAQTALLKLSLLFFYISMFPSIGLQRLLWGTVIFVVLWGIAFVFASIFQCQPVSYFWKHWDGVHQRHCVDNNAIKNIHAAISIALDFWILGIPLSQLWGIRMHWKKKLCVALVFSVGTFVTVVSILRLQVLIDLSFALDASWEFYNIWVWSTIEICVGVICVCLPAIRQLLARFLPFINGSSARSRQRYYYFDRSNGLHKISPGTGDGPTELEEPDGIMVEISYMITLDEVSLISSGNGRRP